MLVRTMCSSILQGIDVNDTDLYFAGSDLFPVLKMGETFAFCQSNGSSPVSNDFWKICCRSGATCSAHVFKIVAVIQSGPSGALCSLNSFQSLTITSVDIWIGSIYLVGELFKEGKLLQSSLVKTD